MGAILSLFWRKRKPDYMQIFSELGERIDELEGEIQGLKQTERRVKGIILLYTTLLCLAGAFSLWFAFDLDNYALGVLLGYPVILYLLRRLTSTIFDRLLKGKEQKLTALKHALSSKIAALKKETAFDTTRELIDRFDIDARKARQEFAKSQAHAQGTIAPIDQDPYSINNPFDRNAVSTSQEGLAQRRKSWSHNPTEPADPNASRFTTLTGSGPTGSGQGQTFGLATARPEPIAPQGGDPIPTPTPEFYLYYPRSWMDRLVDRILGNEDERTSKYAIICKRCFFHNGLVLPEEVGNVAFYCARCGYYNQPDARHRRTPPSAEPQSPTQSPPHPRPQPQPRQEKQPEAKPKPQPQPQLHSQSQPRMQESRRGPSSEAYRAIRRKDSRGRRPTLTDVDLPIERMFDREPPKGRAKSQPSGSPVRSRRESQFVDAPEPVVPPAPPSDPDSELDSLVQYNSRPSPTMSQGSDTTSQVSEWPEQSYIRQRTIRPTQS